jgi:hypothetical protein
LATKSDIVDKIDVESKSEINSVEMNVLSNDQIEALMVLG